MIVFKCPRCKTSLSRDDAEAGSKIPCPSCDQRLQIPLPYSPPASRVPIVVVPVVQTPQVSPVAFDWSGYEHSDSRADRFDEDDYRPSRRRRNRGNGTVALVWGLIAFFVFPLVGPVAIYVANQALREDPYDGCAKAGLILGWIITICLIVPISLIVGIFIGGLLGGLLVGS